MASAPPQRRASEASRDDSGPQAPEDVTVETDSEYPEINLNDCPETILVQASGNHKIDGAYRRLPKLSRGKPSYIKNSGDLKPVYIFFNVKWSIGFEFGAGKCCASVKDSGMLSPCEPYPFVWKVQKKKERRKDGVKDGVKDKKENKEQIVGMRVIAGEVLDVSLQTENLLVPNEPPLAGAASSGGRVRKRGRGAPTPQQAGARTRARLDESGKSAAGAGASNSRKASAADDDLEAAALEGGDDDEDNSEVPSDSSDSDSSDESSSESASPSNSHPSPKAKVAPKVVPKVEARESMVKLEAKDGLARQPDSEQGPRTKKFEQIVRGQLEKTIGKEAKIKKLQKIREMADTTGKLQEAFGMDRKDVFAFLDQLERELGLAKAKQPSSEAQPRQPVKAEKLEKLEKKEKLEIDLRTEDIAQSMATAAPTTPVEDGLPVGGSAGSAESLHRTAKRPRGVLRAPYAARRPPSRRIMLPGDERSEVTVTSYRGAGESLWYTMPGSLVSCDHCEKEVPQTMGSLQGAPSQSQFAQFKFLCSECMGL